MQAQACDSNNTCYAISRCIEGCVSEACIVECVEGFSKIEGRRLFTEWTEAFASESWIGLV